MKVVVDAERDRSGQFLITGSQKFTLMKGVGESLAGRAAIVELEPLAFAEARAARPELQLLEFIVRGGMPELHGRPDLDLASFQNSYLATYLERDVRALANVGSLRDFERFLRACALRSANLLNKADLARDVGIAPSTANQWLSILEASGQVALLEPWFSNRTKTMVKSPKLYLQDTGLLCSLLNIRDAASLLQAPYVGAVWETFVLVNCVTGNAWPIGRVVFSSGVTARARWIFWSKTPDSSSCSRPSGRSSPGPRIGRTCRLRGRPWTVER